ncbi:phosphonatase-like hydrolase [Paraflavitalea sp. CAU 1676]|uniref:phosphonatase-like hydrolase n=1 Tax=Paraflavitalea sp. CAU 1676 TaxID=3032598 RepID=UPI0023DA972E|nr:phosphonatase-like hydrolase [Paraflavitalea sp. CAU 1676]MDF2190636.1 phosphonatase-like hydrolase [Paraflavitalea sp. CAU 1676]
MIRMAIFDMAGTTVNEDNLVYKAVRQAINEKGFDFTLEEVLAEGAGKEKLQAIKSVLTLREVNDDVLAEDIFKRFLVLLDEAYATQPVTEQPNATRLFHTLRQNGVLVVMNTGYDRRTAESLIKKIGWEQGVDFDALVTASDVKHNRPQPDMILLAMKQHGIEDPAETLKVGDSIIDIEEGRNARCHFSIGITTGAHTFEQLESAAPDFILHNLQELLPIVEAVNAGGHRVI